MPENGGILHFNSRYTDIVPVNNIIKAYKGVELMFHAFLTQTIVGSQLHASATLPRGDHRYPLDRRLDGRGSEEKNVWPCRESNLVTIA
jgi:hypothetical protein